MKKRNIVMAALAICVLAGTTTAFSRTTYAGNEQNALQIETKDYTDAEVAQLLSLVKQQQSKIAELEQDFVRLSSGTVSDNTEQNNRNNRNDYAGCHRNGGGYGSCHGYRTFEN